MPLNLPIVGEIFWNSLLIKEPYLCSLPQQNVSLSSFTSWSCSIGKEMYKKSVMHEQSFLISFAVVVAYLKLPLVHMQRRQYIFLTLNTFLVVSCHFKNSEASLPPFSYSTSLQEKKIYCWDKMRFNTHTTKEITKTKLN